MIENRLLCLVQRMPLAVGGSAAGLRKLPTTTGDARHMPAAGPANHAPWTQGVDCHYAHLEIRVCCVLFKLYFDVKNCKNSDNDYSKLQKHYSSMLLLSFDTYLHDCIVYKLVIHSDDDVLHTHDHTSVYRWCATI